MLTFASNRIGGNRVGSNAGRLTIFFGANDGIGKRRAMLLAAVERVREKQEVLIGALDARIHPELQQLLRNLHTSPVGDGEFDLDAALKRRPRLILLEALAHENAEGSRHPKRWQDVDELLEAGIDVYSTLNVSQLESLKDDMQRLLDEGVTHTLPDSVFDQADEVILIDLPEGMSGRKAENAASHQQQRAYEQAEKSMALREFALRQTLHWLDVRLLDRRSEQGVADIWPIGERILVCIGPDASAEYLVRAGKRFANSLRATWCVLYVETPQLARLSVAKRDGVLRILRLAEQLGAETSTLHAPELAAAIMRYARERNINKLLLGRPRRSGWKRWLLGSVVDVLAKQADNINLYLLANPHGPAPAVEADQTLPGLNREAAPGYYLGYVWAIVITALCALLGHAVYEHIELSNLVMVFLLGVVFIAMRFGRGPSIVASILAVGVFDLFFVDPYLGLSPANSQYLITLLAMLIVAMVISNQMVNVRTQARVAAHRERRAAVLYAMSKELAGSRSESDVVAIAVRHLHAEFGSQAVILLPDDAHRLQYPSQAGLPQSLKGADLGVAQWVYEHNDVAGQGTHTLNHATAVYFPIHDEHKTLGVLALLPVNLRRVFLPEQQRLLETLLSQIAQAISRIRFAEQARANQMQIEVERLRNALLSAISHDLRTPLATIIGSASALADDDGHLQAADKLDLSRAIVDEAERMANLVNNLLDMARLDAGSAELNKQWYPVEEIIGSVLTRQRKFLADRQVKVSMPPGIPMLHVDAVMIEQVLINLLENAIRYTPAGSDLEIIVETTAAATKIAVADHGPGIPPGLEEKLFEKFFQSRCEAAQSGVGLGLAICRAIIEVHGGRITAQNRPDGGAWFELSLPFDESPPLLAPEE